MEGAKKVYDLGSPEKAPGHLSVTWAGLEDLADCWVLLDDLMNVTGPQFAQLRRLLSYTSRHHSVNVIACAHSVVRNNIYSLLDQFSEFHFTLNKSNGKNLASVCDALMVSKAARSGFVARFLEEPGKYGTFVLDNARRTFERQGDGGGGEGAAPAPPGRDLDPFKRTAERLIPVFCKDPTRSTTIFLYLLEGLPLGSISSSDLTITLRRQQSEAPVRLSLLDYLLCLAGDSKPSADFLALHRYAKKYVYFPECFVQNAHLRRA